MDNAKQIIISIASATVAYFAPIKGLLIVTFVFVGIDFVTGVWASYVVAKRDGTEWAFSSEKAWNTVTKLVFIIIGIVLAWVLSEEVMKDWDIGLHRIFAGFACGVEFYSYIENAAKISNHPIFRWVRRHMIKKVKDAGIDIPPELDDTKKKNS